jgi:hypothetical protein
MRREGSRSAGGTPMRYALTLFTLLILHATFCVSRGEILDQQLQKWVDESTLTFTGTILQMGTNVSGFDAKDFPMIVQVDKVESGDQQALKKFGDLKGAKLTVAVNPDSRNGLKENISVMFFVDPFVYETNIGVIAKKVAVLDKKTAEDFSSRVRAAALKKSEAPLRREVAGAELIITGEVVAVGPLASNKAVDLGSVHNGWELFSEHRPRWMEAVIKVQKKLHPKGGPDVPCVIVVFPTAHDCFWGDSPKFQVKESGIWLLHRDQLDEREKELLLLRTEKFNELDVQSYTALAPADFQDSANLDRIQKIIAETK